ncbi:hypothetical protein QTP86_004994 [Hemibagrus guttatus]|nr:hypothetical protein QTP86_004994 [Hemibagrus guttatus]
MDSLPGKEKEEEEEEARLKVRQLKSKAQRRTTERGVVRELSSPNVTGMVLPVSSPFVSNFVPFVQENISENQGEGVQDSGETGHAVWFRDSVTEEETGVRARGSRAADVEIRATEHHQTTMPTALCCRSEDRGGYHPTEGSHLEQGSFKKRHAFVPMESVSPGV